MLTQCTTPWFFLNENTVPQLVSNFFTRRQPLSPQSNVVWQEIKVAWKVELCSLNKWTSWVWQTHKKKSSSSKSLRSPHRNPRSHGFPKLVVPPQQASHLPFCNPKGHSEAMVLMGKNNRNAWKPQLVGPRGFSWEKPQLKPNLC